MMSSATATNVAGTDIPWVLATFKFTASLNVTGR